MRAASRFTLSQKIRVATILFGVRASQPFKLESSPLELRRESDSLTDHVDILKIFQRYDEAPRTGSDHVIRRKLSDLIRVNLRLRLGNAEPEEECKRTEGEKRCIAPQSGRPAELQNHDPTICYAERVIRAREQ